MPNEKPTVSVILPAYNSARFIQTTLDSIFAQDFHEYEIIVIDDGSTDATAEICRRQGARVLLIQQTNQGISEARNSGLRAAAGRYIAFIDHDDYWHPKKLSSQVGVLEKMDAGTGVCYGEFLDWDGIDTPSFPSSEISQDKLVLELSGWIYHQLLLTNWVLFTTALFRREVFDSIGLFDRELPPGDDWDIALRASRKFRFVKLVNVVALYRRHDGQTSLKCFSRDFQSELRESMILRYGLAGPDGQLPNTRELDMRRLRSHLSFCAAHSRMGSSRIAGKALANAFVLSPLSLDTWRGALSMVKTMVLRTIKAI